MAVTFRQNSVLFETAFVLVVLLLIHHVCSYIVGNNPYHIVETLDPRGNYRLEWLTELDKKIVTFNVTVKTRGYVGFGLSANGKMGGADIVIGGVRSNGKAYFSDRHAAGNQVPEMDPSQDWSLLGAWENATHTFLSFSRPFDTCDPQDYPITGNKISLIWAYGEHDDELEYHHQNKGEYSVYLLDPSYEPQVKRNDNGIIEKAVGMPKDLKRWTIATRLTIPSADTTYWCTVHAAPKLQGKHHIIGMDTRFDSDQSGRHVHHFAIHKCHVPPGASARALFEPFLNHIGNECFRLPIPGGAIPSQYCTEFFWTWAAGGRPFFLPPHTGLPIGESPEEYFVIQMHYDNPNQLAGVTVEANIDFLYTSNLRSNDAGLMTVRAGSLGGLPPTILIPPSTREHHIYAHCSPQCTEQMFPTEGITFVAGMLHAHNSGVGIRFQHFRGNRELPWILVDDNYDNLFQQFRVLKEDVKVLPGDQLTAQCTFDNTWTNSSVVSGYSTRQEMCTVLAVYYTKLENHGHCFSEMETEEFRDYFLGIRNVSWSTPDIEYLVDAPHPLAGLTITEVSDNHVGWNLAKRAELARFHLLHPQVNNCPRLTTDSIEGATIRNGEFVSADTTNPLVSYPVHAIPYKPKDSCSLK